jgi:hypothetical protein
MIVIIVTPSKGEVMRAILPVAAFLVSAAALVPAGPAAAGTPLTVQADTVVGAGLLSNNTVFILDAVSGTVTIAARPPVVTETGSLTTIDPATQVQTQVACTIDTVAAGCTQVNLLCGPGVTSHTVIGAIPGTSFKGSLDGLDVRAGSIVTACVDLPAPAAAIRR